MRFHLFIYPLLFLAGTLVSAENELDLSQVAGSGTAEQMRGMIASGADLKSKDISGRNALMQAVLFGNHETALVLLENEHDLESKDSLGLTPLTISVRYGDTEMTKILLEHGANVNSTMEDGSSPLYFAALEGQLSS